MGKYTEGLEDRAWNISPDDDNYIEELEEVVKSFRNLDEALDEFIFSHGYMGQSMI